MFCGAVVRSQGASVPGRRPVSTMGWHTVQPGRMTEREGIGEGWGGGELYTRTMHTCTVYIVSWMQQDKVAFIIAVYSDVVV